MDTIDYLDEAHLRFVTDKKPGITRVAKGDKKFWYYDNDGKQITDENTLERIQSLVIPPAWKQVWICPYKNGYLQATGIDSRKRKQYRYHHDWTKVRQENKFDRLLQFAEALPLIRNRVDNDLAKDGLPREKVLAAVIWLMERTLIRVGNEEYAEKNHSYGLTTLENRHADLWGDKIYLHFRGKSGVMHKVHIKSKRVAKIIRKCKDIPGQELFQYYDQSGAIHDVNSQDVNNYLKEITGMDVTAKDFRTWGGTIKAAQIFDKIGIEELKTKQKENTTEVVKEVATYLRNKPATCKKYYIHPAVMNQYNIGITISCIDKKQSKKVKLPKGLEHFENSVYCLIQLQ